MTEALVEVVNLRTTFALGGRSVEAVRGVSFSIAPGEVLGLIGESGSGKTVTGLSLLRLLPDHAAVTADALRFRGGDLTALSNDAFPSREFDFMLSNPPYGKSWKTDLERMGGKDEMRDARFIIDHAGDNSTCA